MAGRNRRGTSGGARIARLAELPWNRIEKPGCYLVLESGNLVVIPSGAFSPGAPPRLLDAERDAHVAMLSERTDEPIASLRSLALAHHYYVRF